MICNKCGSQIPNDTIFCNVCGEKINNDVNLQNQNGGIFTNNVGVGAIPNQGIPVENTVPVQNMAGVDMNVMPNQGVPVENTVPVQNMVGADINVMSNQGVPVGNTVPVQNMAGVDMNVMPNQGVLVENTVPVQNMAGVDMNTMPSQGVPVGNTVPVQNMVGADINVMSNQGIPVENTVPVQNMNIQAQPVNNMGQVPNQGMQQQGKSNNSFKIIVIIGIIIIIALLGLVSYLLISKNDNNVSSGSDNNIVPGEDNNGGANEQVSNPSQNNKTFDYGRYRFTEVSGYNYSLADHQGTQVLQIVNSSKTLAYLVFTIVNGTVDTVASQMQLDQLKNQFVSQNLSIVDLKDSISGYNYRSIIAQDAVEKSGIIVMEIDSTSCIIVVPVAKVSESNDNIMSELAKVVNNITTTSSFADGSDDDSNNLDEGFNIDKFNDVKSLIVLE